MDDHQEQELERGLDKSKAIFADHEEDEGLKQREEDKLPLEDFMDKADSFVTGEQFRANPFERFQQDQTAEQDVKLGVDEDAEEYSAERQISSDDDPFSPYREDEFARQNGLSAELEDASTEFGGELAPVSPVTMPTFGRRNSRSVEESRGLTGMLQEGADEMAEELPDAHTASGWIAIVLAIGSLFYWPAILGPAAAVGGVIAYLLGNRTLGGWSVILGLIAVAAHLFLIPYAS